MPVTEILSGPFSPERQPLRRNGILDLPLEDATRRIVDRANHAGMRIESVPRLSGRLVDAGRRVSGVFRGHLKSSENRRIEMVLIEEVTESSPGYDFHIVLWPEGDSTTHIQVAVLNHTVTFGFLMEQRLEHLMASLQ